MSKTQDNLMAAFAGESQANRKYLAFAQVADKEGLPQVAKLFRAAAAAETVHAPPPISSPPLRVKRTNLPRCTQKW